MSEFFAFGAELLAADDVTRVVVIGGPGAMSKLGSVAVDGKQVKRVSA